MDETGEVERRKFVPPPKVPKTAEDIAAIAVLDALRSGEGEAKPTHVPLACVVKVLDSTDVPKAREAYSMVTVMGPDKRTWRLCVYRGRVKVGKNMLFIGEDAALPIMDRWRNPMACKVKEKVYNFGFGVKVRRLLPHVQRHIYKYNCGVLYPLTDFPELKGARAGKVCAVQLGIDNAPILQARLQAPRSDKIAFLRQAGL